MHKFSENIKTTYGNQSTALASETASTITATKFVDMAKFDLYTAIAQVIGAATNGVLTLRLWEATGTDGSGSQSLAITDTFTANHASDTDILIAQVRGEQLSAGYQYVGCKLSTSVSTATQIVSMIQTQSRARYAQASL